MTSAAVRDAERVTNAIAAGALLHPNEGTPGPVDLAIALAVLNGARRGDLPDGADRILRAIGEPEHIVLVLVDGLGIHLVETLPDDSFLRSHLAMELRTVYPSSTAPALTSLATGCWPAEHAVTGWWTYVPEAGITSTILPFIERFSGKPGREYGLTAQAAFPRPPLMNAYKRAAASVQPKAIAGSVYSRYFAGGAEEYGYERPSGAVEHIVARIDAAEGATFTYFYVSVVDTLQHIHGTASGQVQIAVRTAQETVAHLARELDGRARVVVTADHGLIDIDRSKVFKLSRDDALVAMLELPPTAEPRAPVFHVRAGRDADFEAMFRERFGSEFALLEIGEAERIGLFGPVAISAETRARLGTHCGVALTAAAILYEPSAELLSLKGLHGGLTPAEMRVPLIVC